MSPQFPIYPATNEIFHDPALLAAEQAQLFENGWIMAEDKWIVGEAQLGTRAGAQLRRGPAHREEARVEHLLQEIARRLCRQEDGAAFTERSPS